VSDPEADEHKNRTGITGVTSDEVPTLAAAVRERREGHGSKTCHLKSYVSIRAMNVQAMEKVQRKILIVFPNVYNAMPTTLFTSSDLRGRRGSSSRLRGSKLNGVGVGGSGGRVLIGGSAGSGLGCVGGGGCGELERPQREEKNEPMPVPQVESAAFASVAASPLTTLRGRPAEVWAEGLGEAVAEAVLDASSASERVTSTGDVVAVVEAEAEMDCRCAAHRPRIPSTALNTFVEPAASALATASRAGASC
jgi:hypothetical protein